MKSTISIVDDDREVRSSLTSLLRSAGYSVKSFEAAESFLAGGVGDNACLLTDLNMPGMSGLDLQEELQRRGAAIPVILMTAFPTEEAKTRALRRGAAAFLTKPLDPDLLLEKLHALLDRH